MRSCTSLIRSPQLHSAVLWFLTLWACGIWICVPRVCIPLYNHLEIQTLHQQESNEFNAVNLGPRIDSDDVGVRMWSEHPAAANSLCFQLLSKCLGRGCNFKAISTFLPNPPQDPQSAPVCSTPHYLCCNVISKCTVYSLIGPIVCVHWRDGACKK